MEDHRLQMRLEFATAAANAGIPLSKIAQVFTKRASGLDSLWGGSKATLALLATAPWLLGGAAGYALAGNSPPNQTDVDELKTKAVSDDLSYAIRRLKMQRELAQQSFGGQEILPWKSDVRAKKRPRGLTEGAPVLA